MKLNNIFLITAASALLASCASKTGGENYDVANPYAAPDYTEGGGTPYQAADVNPPYDAPAVYEDSSPAPSRPAPVSSPYAADSGSGKVHTVGKGDTLWGIGKKYGVSVDAIKQANQLSSDVAVLGAKLIVPAR